jgi:dethiobiotin synthetase
MTPIIVTGTDTGIGKTVFAAGLAGALGAAYWKPVQSGLDEATDSETVATLSGAPILPEAYRLTRPASPHLSAEHMGIEIDPARLTLPDTEAPLVVEGAGGLMVPLTRRVFFLDVIAAWRAPVVLVARTQLGTINHTTLSLRALASAGVDVVGVAFVGEAEPEVEETIAQMNSVAHLGRLGPLSPLTRATLTEAMQAIDLDRIRSAM